MRRDAASSVAPIGTTIGTPCVLASRAPSAPQRRGPLRQALLAEAAAHAALELLEAVGILGCLRSLAHARSSPFRLLDELARFGARSDLLRLGEQLPALVASRRPNRAADRLPALRADRKSERFAERRKHEVMVSARRTTLLVVLDERI